MRTFITIAFGFSLTMVSAQITFQKTYGGGGNDYGFSVQETSNGDFICLGHTNTFLGRDIFLLKTDAEGNELWTQSIGSENSDCGYSVQETTDGGYILCGAYNGFSSDSLALIRTTSDGVILWNKRYSGSADADVGWSVVQTSDNGFIAAGFTGASMLEDIFILKTDENGNEEWSQAFPSSGREYAIDIKQLAGNGFIIAGETNSTGAGGRDMLLMRTDESGDILWTRTFGTELDEIGRSVQVTDDGGFIMVGHEDFQGGNVILVKTDDQGTEEWLQEFETDGRDWGNSVEQAPDGGYVIGGSKWNTTDLERHMYCIGTDENGNIIWEYTYPKGVNSNANAIDLTDDGGIVLLGHATFTSGITGFNADLYLVKIRGDGTVGLSNESSSYDSIQFYPNPFSEYLDLDIGQIPTENMSIELIDVFGKLIYQEEIGLMQKRRILTSSIESGVYIALLKQDDRVVSSRTIIAQ